MASPPIGGHDHDPGQPVTLMLHSEDDNVNAFEVIGVEETGSNLEDQDANGGGGVEIITGNLDADELSSAYILNQETGELQLIEFDNVDEINEDVEFVSVDTDQLHFVPVANSLAEAGELSRVDTEADPSTKAVGNNVNVKQTTIVSPRLPKSAPALLRNSRRSIKIQEQGKDMQAEVPGTSSSFISTKTDIGTSTSPSKSNRRNNRLPQVPKPKVPREKKGSKFVQSPTFTLPPQPQFVILNENDESLSEISQIDLSNLISIQEPEVNEEAVIVQKREPVCQPTYILLQSEDGTEQVTQIFQPVSSRGTVWEQRGNFIYQLDSNPVQHVGKVPKPAKTAKPKSPRKRAKKVSSNNETRKKVPGQELKCMEPGCSVEACNIVELRKHLTNQHDMIFDSETMHFASGTAFKEWREQYERERMVSFIYRGGTKKISKTNSVTYMVCHRSGHYKPTMSDASQRKRRMKPQGSCKIGGYCTAGIKLLKNLITDEIKMEICHTHYGHPLDSEAIPHLRVNPVLRKIILKKFEEGMNLSDMLGYIHHNPDGLEGLRVVDRRAVRNIYDTWRKPELKKEMSVAADNHEDKEESAEKMEVESETEGPILEKVDPENKDSVLSKDTTEETATGIEETSNSPSIYINIESIKSLSSKSKPSSEAKTNGPAIAKSSRLGPSISVALGSSKVVTNPAAQSPEKSSYQLRPNRKVEVYKGKSRKRPEKVGPNTTREPSLVEASTSNIEAIVKKSIDNDNKVAPKISQKEEVVKHKLPKLKPKPDKQENPTPISGSQIILSTTPASSQPPDIVIHPELEAKINKLHNHGESGPTILLFKRLGDNIPKYGGFSRVFKEDEFCLIIQTPVQRQIMQMFPKIICLECLEGPQSDDHGLKLTYISVLDDYREPIPVTWMISDSTSSKVINQFFKVLRYHCGELPVQYIMAPRNLDVRKLWTSHFSTKPKILLSDFSVKRELRNILNRNIPNDSKRSTAWGILEQLMYGRDLNAISNLKQKLLSTVKSSKNGSTYIKKMEKDWFSRLEEWSFAYRVGFQQNLLFISEDFLKLKKFVSFKGTRGLNQSVDHILKIAYDKCFLRTKRMFKGDQKFSLVLDRIDKNHEMGKNISNENVIMEDDHTWKIEGDDGESSSEEVFFLGSSCDCKVLCRACGVCMHQYLCTCEEFRKGQTMCQHIHKVHCLQNLEEEEPQERVYKIEGDNVKEELENDQQMEEENMESEADITIINQADLEALNIPGIYLQEATMFHHQHQDQEEVEEMEDSNVITIVESPEEIGVVGTAGTYGPIIYRVEAD